MNEFNNAGGSGNASSGNTATGGSLSGGNRRRFPRRGGRKPAPSQGVAAPVSNEARNLSQKGDVLSSGLKDALTLGSFEGAVARSQAYKPEHATSPRGEGAKTRPAQRQGRRQQSKPANQPGAPVSGQKPAVGASQPATGKPVAKKSSRKQSGGRRQQFPVKIELATTRGWQYLERSPSGRESSPYHPARWAGGSRSQYDRFRVW